MLLLEEFEDVIGFQEVKTSKVIEIEKDVFIVANGLQVQLKTDLGLKISIGTNVDYALFLVFFHFEDLALGKVDIWCDNAAYLISEINACFNNIEAECLAFIETKEGKLYLKNNPKLMQAISFSFKETASELLSFIFDKEPCEIPPKNQNLDKAFINPNSYYLVNGIKQNIG